MSDCNGAALMLPALPKAKELLADRGATTPTGSAPPSPDVASQPACLDPYDPVLYRQRYKIENMPRRIKD